MVVVTSYQSSHYNMFNNRINMTSYAKTLKVKQNYIIKLIIAFVILMKSMKLLILPYKTAALKCKRALTLSHVTTELYTF